MTELSEHDTQHFFLVTDSLQYEEDRLRYGYTKNR